MPRGQAVVGWRIGVWWAHDRTFYVGDVTSYSATTGRSANDPRLASLCLWFFCWPTSHCTTRPLAGQHILYGFMECAPRQGNAIRHSLTLLQALGAV